MMSLEIELEEAFASNQVEKITVALLEEKSSKTSVNRLDKVANKELDKNEFGHVTLLLKGIESLCLSNGEDVINNFVQQGLVAKMLMWFERALEFLKIEEMRSNKFLPNLIEECYDAALSICKISTEGKNQMHDTFVLRLGMLVTDPDVMFCLRLEGIRTINSILDIATKEDRKKMSLSEQHCSLLEELAKLIVDAGDYEIQVAISEALCRMTLKKWREDLVYQWFVNPDFANSFKEINDREFETDCRKFLNKVNSSLGDIRRVYTFPCIQAFLGTKELHKPDDAKLEEFWVDFNIGSSCISFFINDPEGALWDSVNLSKGAVSWYVVEETSEQKILTIHTEVLLSVNSKEGKTVRIIFDTIHDILSVVKMIFGEEKLQKSLDSEWKTSVLNDIKVEKSNSIFPSPEIKKNEPSSSSSASEAREDPVGVLDAPEARENLTHQVGKTSEAKKKDVFAIETQSESEVNVAVAESEALTPASKNLSQVRRTESNSFKEVLKSYKIMKAKARIFSRSFSSDRSMTASTPVTEKELNEAKKRLPWQSKRFFSESEESPEHSEASLNRELKRSQKKMDYTRKKPKNKSRLKILPLSSPSSENELSNIRKHSTPKSFQEKRKENQSGIVQFLNDSEEDLELPVLSTQLFEPLERGPVTEEKPLKSLVHVANDEAVSAKEPVPNEGEISPEPKKRKFGLGPGSEAVLPEEAAQHISSHRLKPRNLFSSKKQESDEEHKVTNETMEDTDSGAEGGSSVISMFETFTNQLRNKFWSRYKRMVICSQHALNDCETSVSTLLNIVHTCRLKNLEQIRETITDQILQLEKESNALMEIEKDTVEFWQTQSQTFASFCERQQMRLKSLELMNPNTRGVVAQVGEPSAQQETKTGNELLVKSTIPQ
ncbi:synaptonemal complex protein 2-like isoform X3 [Lepisosteus oculatus]|uniref:synaptonemal complex protein 2-like isoform X3 n=1 Tax=Lepisosteus oculatus TaxID=7918 RepID=UPI0037158C12